MYRPASALLVFDKRSGAEKYVNTMAKPDDNWVVREFEERG